MSKFGIVAAVALMAVFSPGIASAADASPSEITFWQSVQNSQNAEEFNAYLEAYPDGAFAGLAKIKIRALSGAAPMQATGAADVAPVAAPAPTADLSDAVMTATPAKIRVGDQVTISIENMPTPYSYDIIVVVAAGSPDTTGTIGGNRDGVLSSEYAANLPSSGNAIVLGPFPPGRYEARWLTVLYNSENRLEVGSRVPFEVTR